MHEVISMSSVALGIYCILLMLGAYFVVRFMETDSGGKCHHNTVIAAILAAGYVIGQIFGN